MTELFSFPLNPPVITGSIKTSSPHKNGTAMVKQHGFRSSRNAAYATENVS